MNAQIVCRQCGKVITEGETVFAVKVAQTIHPLHQACAKECLLENRRIRYGDFTTKTWTNQQVIKVHKARLRHSEADELVLEKDPFFAIHISYIKGVITNTSLNGNEA